jgi:hypothetical protein
MSFNMSFAIMKLRLIVVLTIFAFAVPAFSAGKGPEINFVNNRLSINAESVPLGRLLRLLDLATGMQSKVPPELANRNLSVRFSDMTLDEGVRKIFQGQPFDYVVLGHQGIIVTSAAQAVAGAESAPALNAAGQQQPVAQPPVEQPFVPDFPPAGVAQAPPVQPGQAQPGQQPAMIQTPFGPIANPRAGQAVQGFQPVQQPQQPVTPQNSLFPANNQAQPQQGLPGAQFPTPTPFGTPSPFGTPQTNTPNNNNLFGNPPVLSAPGGTTRQ